MYHVMLYSYCDLLELHFSIVSARMSYYRASHMCNCNDMKLISLSLLFILHLSLNPILDPSTKSKAKG